MSEQKKTSETNVKINEMNNLFDNNDDLDWFLDCLI